MYALLVYRNKITKQAEADHSYNAFLQHFISLYKWICSMLCNVITCVVRKQLKRHGSFVISLQETVTHIWSGFSELSVLWSTWYIMDWINTPTLQYFHIQHPQRNFKYNKLPTDTWLYPIHAKYNHCHLFIHSVNGTIQKVYVLPKT